MAAEAPKYLSLADRLRAIEAHVPEAARVQLDTLTQEIEELETHYNDGFQYARDLEEAYALHTGVRLIGAIPEPKRRSVR